jgi:hypothetical protein
MHLAAPPLLPRLRVPRVANALTVPLAPPDPRAGPTAQVLAGGGSAAGLAAFPWDRAAPAGPLILADGSAAAEQATVVRAAWNDAALWVRFECADRDAWGTYDRRNDPIYEEEAVEIFLAPGEADPRVYWELEVSPRGTLFGARIHHPTGRRADLAADTTWPATGLAWQAAPAGRGNDWWAALAIPWAALIGGHIANTADIANTANIAGIAAAREAGSDVGAALPRLWRANFYRIERPRDGLAEFSCWSPTLANPPDFHRPARFGTLELV